MSPTFRIHADALEELGHTLAEMEHASAAAHLELAVLAALERVATAPLAYPLVDPKFAIRRHVLPDLSRFAILYVANERRILVLAIADGRREPGYWRVRLRDD